MRIAALAGIPVVYVMTHDSIGLGEDGPTHQPVEHLAALRAMPNMRVFRPADAIETAECWQLALERTDGPTTARADPPEPAAGPQGRRREATSRRTGAYELSPAIGKARATIFASGSEVEIALAAQKLLAGPELRGSRRVGAFARPVPGSAREGPRPDHRRCAGQGRGRGGRALRLGCGHRPGRHFRRHAWVSAPARPTRTFTSISASPPKPWPKRFSGRTISEARETLGLVAQGS